MQKNQFTPHTPRRRLTALALSAVLALGLLPGAALAADGAEDANASGQTLSSSLPTAVTSYLPAPGQFVNVEDYRDPAKTLGDTDFTKCVTLGAFGGYVVYEFKQPIKNDPNNPYGVDFIVWGNAYSSSAGEPAAVMVSQDGVTWYELAGSEYYAPTTRRGVTVTYTNSGTSFTDAVDIPWEDSVGNSGVLPVNSYHTQPYYPNPALYTAADAGSSYTADSASFTGTLLAKGAAPAFGYGDSHPNDLTLGNAAVNPYRADPTVGCNGDGFDLAWAVNAEGKHVALDSVHYVKLYSAKLSYDAVMGEVSPEITAVLRAKPAENDVGVSDGLTGLTVNGQSVALKDGVYTYTVDAGHADTLTVTPTAENPDANIYVSGERVASGASSTAALPVETLRIIVQEGEKAPVLYYLNITNILPAEQNTALQSVTLTPGDVTLTPDGNGTLTFSVASNVASVRLAATAANSAAAMVLTTGGSSAGGTALENGTATQAIPLQVGENRFTLTVTSTNGQKSQDYTLVINRAAAPSDSGTIRVTFSLTGDTVHYDWWTMTDTAPHTGDTWIAAQTVTVPAGATVKYVTELMLNNHALTYVSDGGYISAVNGLTAGDNGPNSGWMYRVNGAIPDEGYGARTLSAGDTVRWFYTDDYTKEQGYEGDWENVNSGAVQSPAAAVPAEAETALPFTDLADCWAVDAIRYVYGAGLMVGVSATEFAPERALSRGMLVTVLYRLAGSPAVTAPAAFSDVTEETWCADAVAWASENGIVLGYADGRFLPGGALTREQLAVMFYRYARAMGYDVSGAGDLSGYTDRGEIGDWALEAMAWANASGLVQGRSATALAPRGLTTRAAAAAILMRFAQWSSGSRTALDGAAGWLVQAVPAPQVGSVGGEWAVLGLARGGAPVPEDYFSSYTQAVTQYVEARKGVLSQRKYTEYARVVLALSALGQDARDVAGYDLTLPLGDYDKVLLQGVNGPIWALLALDARSYPMPQNSDAKTQATRQMYVDYILSCQLSDGGWALSGGAADPDLTGMALQALAKYRTQPAVAAAVEKALALISARQTANGAFDGWGTGGAEGTAQLLTALCELGISLENARFVKGGHTVLDGLLTFQQADGSFVHLAGDSAANQMATEQGLYALAAAWRAAIGAESLYRMAPLAD